MKSSNIGARIVTISTDEVARLSNCKRRAAFNSLKKLEQLKIITKHTNFTFGKGGKETNQYSINSEPIEDDGKPAMGFEKYGIKDLEHQLEISSLPAIYGKKHVRLDRNLLMNDAFLSLTPSQRYLHHMLLADYDDNNKIFNLTYEYVKELTGSGKHKTKRDIQALLDKEFLGVFGNKNQRLFYLQQYGSGSASDKKHGFKSWKKTS